MYWNVTVIILCLLLLLFLLWKEIKRPNKLWLSVRIIASTLSVTSLACLALPLTINRTAKANSISSYILLTEGFNSDSVQSVLKDNSNAKIYTTDKKINSFNPSHIPDATVFENLANDKIIHVFGYGVDESDLKLLNNAPIIFHPSSVANAVTNVGWQQQLKSGEQLIVQGTVNNSNSSTAKIILSGFNTNLDSVIVSAKQSSYFQLKTTPKNLDKAVYSITVLEGKDTVESEPIPVEVSSTQPLSILVLATSPDFENKFLKNWLTQNEYKFAVRTTISKDKFDKEYVNMPATSLERITPALLDKFDILIADASALSTLSASDLASIKNSVANKGTGLIVKADTIVNSSSFYSSSFPLVATKDSIQHTLRLNLSDTSEQTSPLKVEQPIYIRDVVGTQALVKDQQAHIIASNKMVGAGKVLLTTLTNTYSWQLSGNNKDYSSYWSLLLSKAAKRILLQEVWRVSPMLPQVSQEVLLQLQTSSSNIPQAQVGQDAVYMEQNIYLPYQWTATYWPTKTGWQPLMNNGGSTVWWYVYDSKDWKAVKAMDKISATKIYEREHHYNASSPSTITTEITTEFPKIYFFVIFLICAATLWFEKKFNNR
jgi:hypothetical protein